MIRITKDQLNASIRDIEIPERMIHLPVSRQGYPVPYFVAKVNGEWDFRVIHPSTVLRCMRNNKCWICGKSLGQYKVFVAGPMCVVTRTSAEPPCHIDCARYAAIACPFLSQPRMKRNDKNMPITKGMPGISILRNPGVAAVYVTRSWKPFSDGNGGVLIQMGDPQRVEWYAQRRGATRKEVVDAIASGIPILVDQSPENERSAIMLALSKVKPFMPAEQTGELTT